MVSPDEVAEEYRAALSELTRNDKTQINLLTILAEDYASYASAIVAVIEERLFKCPSPMKIVMLYVLDSIVKNIPATSGAYRDLFAKRIVDMIVHVFKEVVSSIRIQSIPIRPKSQKSLKFPPQPLVLRLLSFIIIFMCADLFLTFAKYTLLCRSILVKR